jgi:DNA modification methylase
VVTEPAYQDDLVTLYCGDARDLSMLESDSAGMVICSPPYNARMRYDGYNDWLDWDSYWGGLIVPFLHESMRVLVPGGRLCVNFANVIRKNVPEGKSDNPPDWEYKGHWRWTPPGAKGEDWAALVDEHFFTTVRQIDGALPRERLTWVKGSEAVWRRRILQMLFDHKITIEQAEEFLDEGEVGGDITTKSTAWGSWLSASNPVLRATAEPIYIVDKLTHTRPKGESDITSDEFKAWTRNTWFVPVRNIVTGKNANPAQFPPEIPRRLMKLYGYTSDLVVDPFAGECTTLVAAKRLGRRSVGIDIGPNQCKRGANRCSQDLLFDEAAA